MSQPPPRNQIQNQVPKRSGPPPRNAPLKKLIEIHTQKNLFDNEGKAESEYTAKITAPIYTPKRVKPHIFELVDRSKSNSLIKAIQESNIPEPEKEFLIHASKRHNIFNYKLIADYYAHSAKDVQLLMEQSALVIIDFDDAIRNGYIKFSTEIAEIYVDEHGKA